MVYDRSKTTAIYSIHAKSRARCKGIPGSSVPVSTETEKVPQTILGPIMNENGHLYTYAAGAELHLRFLRVDGET